jgi:hypothetical protein
MSSVWSRKLFSSYLIIPPVATKQFYQITMKKKLFLWNSDIQNSQKLDPLEIAAKKFQAKIS